MANRYLIHGATYCGDGTASNEAASAGAAGAWNNTNILTGTTPPYGTLSAGDTVYIRSKSSAGADLTITASALTYLGNSAALAASPITWILDNGSVWAGIDGTLTFSSANVSYYFYLRNYNILVSKTQDAIRVVYTATTASGGYLFRLGVGAQATNIKLDTTAKTGTAAAFASVVLMDEAAILENPSLVIGALGGSSSTYAGVVCCNDYNRFEPNYVINPSIELTNATPGVSVLYLGNDAGNFLYVHGGRIFGAGAITGQNLALVAGSGGVGLLSCIGFSVPRAMTMYSGQPTNGTTIELVGCDDGIGGFYQANWGWATSRTDNYPPTLSATLPDTGSTPWAWRVYPQYVSALYQMRLTTTKFFTGAAATKTITQEVLIADSISTANKGSLWLTVEYVDDTTGLTKHLTTRDYAGGALASSTAGWSATTWGMINLLKRKLEVTTPTSVKQNTPIVVTLWGLVKSVTANDIMFVDPDFGVN